MESPHDGVVLRPWEPDDVGTMVELFDTAEMDRWTPLPHPFDEDAARQYLVRAEAGVASGTRQYAITLDGDEPLGEVILFPAADGGCELAYATGARHRGQRLGVRAVRTLLREAATLGYREAMLSIAVDNVRSQKVAQECGFALTDEPLRRRERKGYVMWMATWRRSLDAADEA